MAEVNAILQAQSHSISTDRNRSSCSHKKVRFCESVNKIMYPLAHDGTAVSNDDNSSNRSD